MIIVHQPEIIAIGEILVDFIPSKIAPLKDLESFQKCAGGAPANFAVGIAKLGLDSGFIGKVGNDPFGKYLKDILEKSHVNTNHIIFAKDEERTSLAFVFFDEQLDRDFFFYRNNAADINLETEEIKKDYFQRVKFLHFGSVSLTHEPIRNSTFKAIEYARNNGAKISFDPNVRTNIWKNEKSLREFLEKALLKTDIFLPSISELRFIFDDQTSEEQDLVNDLFQMYPLEVVAVKKGAEGCLLKKRMGFFSKIPSFEVNVIDTTGAGDGFNAGFIFGLFKNFSLEEAGLIGNAVGALVVQKKGAMESLPTIEELKNFFAKQKIEISIE